LFGDTLHTVKEVVYLSFFLFFDRMLETFASENIDQWIHNILENSQKTYSDNLELQDDDNDDYDQFDDGDDHDDNYFDIESGWLNDEDEDDDDDDYDDYDKDDAMQREIEKEKQRKEKAKKEKEKQKQNEKKNKKKKRNWSIKEMREEDAKNMLIAFFIFLVRGFVQWMRNIFIINFFFDRYDIIAIYMAADAFAGCIHIYRKELKKTEADGYFVASLEPGSRALLVSLSLCQTVEMIIVLFVLILGRWDLSSYFTFDNPDYFGLPLDSQLKIGVITALAVVIRLYQTIYNRVILPDFYHYTYSDLQRYTDSIYWTEVMFNTLMTTSVHWIAYMFTVQLITATSLKFVTIFIAVDIPVSILIVLVYIWKKARMLRNIEYIKISNKQTNMAIISHQTLGISTIKSKSKSTSKSKSKSKSTSKSFNE
jgi:hypothetical protein